MACELRRSPATNNGGGALLFGKSYRGPEGIERQADRLRFQLI